MNGIRVVKSLYCEYSAPLVYHGRTFNSDHSFEPVIRVLSGLRLFAQPVFKGRTVLFGCAVLYFEFGMINVVQMS